MLCSAQLPTSVQTNDITPSGTSGVGSIGKFIETTLVKVAGKQYDQAQVPIADLLFTNSSSGFSSGLCCLDDNKRTILLQAHAYNKVDLLVTLYGQSFAL